MTIPKNVKIAKNVAKNVKHQFGLHRRECSPVIPKDCTVKLTPASGKNAFSDVAFDEVQQICLALVVELDD